MKDNNSHPYYNRPSLQTSYQIALLAIIGLVLTVLGLMVSEVVSDFDNTSIHKTEDNKREISYQMETIDERMLKKLKNRKMKVSIY